MTVFILHYDVAYEFGQVLGVYATEELANKACLANQQGEYKIDPCDLTVEEHDVETE
jgi:hypothetical protein